MVKDTKQVRMTWRIAVFAAAVALTSGGGVVHVGKGILARSKPQEGLIVHEWGTFTSVVDRAGNPLVWHPLFVASDLPGFVYGIGANGKRPGPRNNPQIKANLSAKIRMETPVVYFYSDREATASLKVDFPQGYVTEWYPAASKAGTAVGWEGFKILPGSTANFPIEPARSRYYAARGTDASPLRVSGSNGPEDEKFLFYRGIGNFDLPLSVRLRQGGLRVQASTSSGIAEAILFVNEAAKEGYQVHRLSGGHGTFDDDAGLQPAASLRGELARMLVQAGLYQREADAMLETWGEHWFEPGERIFYVLPRAATDSILPMTIDPLPTELQRVIVCRVEIITPEMEQAVAEQIPDVGSDSTEVRATAEKMIAQHGRFLEPLLENLSQKANDRETKARVDEFIKVVITQFSSAGDSSDRTNDGR